jgi:hypothetical protein
MNDLSDATLRAIERLAASAGTMTPAVRRDLLLALAQVAFAEGAVHTLGMIQSVPAASAAIEKARATHG